MKKYFTIFALGVIKIGLLVIFIQSLINQEIYGRFGNVIKMEYYPERYWMGILLLLFMIGMLAFWIIKVWQEE